MQIHRQSILPVFAILLAVFGITYSACNDSKADQGDTSPASEIRQEITRMEQKYKELSQLHESQVQRYATDMGCSANSTTLETINKHQAILDHFNQRIQYHKLQLIQADTANTGRNGQQLEELKKDLQDLSNNEAEIRNGLDKFTPTHVTK